METINIDFKDKASLDEATGSVVATAIQNGHLFGVRSLPSQNKYQISVSSASGFTKSEKKLYKSFSKQ